MKLFYPDIKTTERGLETTDFFYDDPDESYEIIGIDDLLGFNEYDPENSFIILVSFSICKPSLIWCLLNNPEFHQQRDPSDKTMSWNVYGDYMEIYRTKKRKNNDMLLRKEVLAGLYGRGNGKASDAYGYIFQAHVHADGKG